MFREICSQHRAILLLTACFLHFSLSAFGQKVTFGIVTGSALTDDFRSGSQTLPQLVTCPEPICASTTTLSSTNDSARFVLGPRVEISLSDRWSLEVEALHRAIGRKMTYTYSPPLDFGNGIIPSTSSSGSDWAWEIPVLATYKLNFLQSGPFLELGPAFRPAENNEQYGIAAGAGIEIRAKNLKLAPRIRYTRWIDKGYGPNPIYRLLRPYPNQVSLLVGISEWTRSSPRISAFGKDLSLRAILGLGLSDDFQTEVTVSDGVPSFRRFSKTRSPVLGVSLEYEPVKDLSIEVNGLYRPLHLTDESLLFMPQQGVYPAVGDTVTVLTWEFPMLGKYRLPVHGTKPFLELGPSLRAIGNTNGTLPSRVGGTVGAGIELGLGEMRLSPTLRYTRWAQDKIPHTRTNRNQFELLFGVSF